jgi:predicted RNase H-like HicB family nuclease
MVKLTKKEKEKIMKLRAQFPQRINVSIRHGEDWGFVARINNYPGCLTEGNTFSELIEMINDCVYTYFEIPLKYLAFMPTYLPKISVASEFDFSQKTNAGEIKTDFNASSDLNEKVAV